ncbi:hypothetical protein [Pseudarthrobacter sp. MDT1-22]
MSALMVSSGPETSSTPSIRPVTGSIHNGRRRAGPLMVRADQVLGGEQLHRPAGDQRLADGVRADPGLGPVRPFGELQPVRTPQHLRAAHPPEDLAAGVGEYQHVPAGTGIVWRGLCWSGLMPRAMERRHESARSVVGRTPVVMWRRQRFTSPVSGVMDKLPSLIEKELAALEPTAEVAHHEWEPTVG